MRTGLSVNDGFSLLLLNPQRGWAYSFHSKVGLLPCLPGEAGQSVAPRHRFKGRHTATPALR